MSIIDTLITDRTQADVEYVQELNALGWSGMSAEQQAEYLAGLKGAYSAVDLNRVTEAMNYLYQLFTNLGYSVPGYAPVSIAHPPEYAVPSGYTQLQYIESSGAQYIDTGYKPNQDTTISARAQYLDDSTTFPVVFGAREGSSNQFWLFLDTNNTDVFSARYGTNQVDVDAGTTEEHDFSLAKNVFSVDEESATAPAATFQSAYTAFLFAVNSSGSPNYYAAVRMYSCSIKDDGTVVRSFVPCINPSGEVGLYDTVNNVFYGNAGTGDFTAGPEYVPPVEDPYTWYVYDIPNVSEMTAYLANVSALRSVLSVSNTTPEVPSDMAGLTYQEANNIEQILTAINDYLVSLQQIFQRAGMSWAVAGGPGFYFAN